MNALRGYRSFYASTLAIVVVCGLITITAPTVTHAQVPAQITQGATPGAAAPAAKPQNTTWYEDLWYAIVAGFSSILVSFSAWLLSVASTLFNWLVQHTIIQFGATGEIYDKIKDAVNAGWAAVRDIANIVIIGIFTFIAISIIIGNKDFGQKKLVARVLIIAVLINFSLLFTKLIIDASNYAATQFYSGIAPVDAQEASAAATGLVPGSAFSKVGVAGAFINYLGVSGVGDTYGKLKAVGTKSGSLAIFSYGILATALLGGAAFVLFYGSYLLLARAVLFIFLMVVSAGAFATHLIPKLSDSDSYGWRAWWKSLLSNAALAPFLMIFLWITLKVAADMKTAFGENGTLGGLLSPGVRVDDLAVLFSYLVILGLLFGSFKLASASSAKIGGFSFTGTALGTAAFAPLALGSRLAAPALRFWRGGGAMKESAGLEKDIHTRSLDLAQMPRKTEGEKAAYSKAFDELAAKMKRKEKADTRAKRSYNLMNAAPMKAAAAGIGVPSSLSGAEAKPKGYADTANARAKEAAKKAEVLAISEKKAEEELLERKHTEAQYKEQKQVLEKQRDAARAMLEAAKAAAAGQQPDVRATEQRHEAAQNNAVAVTNQANQERAQIKNRFDPILKQINQEIMDPATPDAQRNQLNMRKRATEAQRQIALEEQENKIKQAQTNVETVKGQVDTLKKSIEEPIARAQEAYGKAKDALDSFENQVKAEVKADAAAVADASAKGAEEMAARIAHRRLTNLPLRMLGTVSEKFGLPGYSAENDIMAMKAREMTKKAIKVKPVKERIMREREVAKEVGADEESESGGEAGGGKTAGPPPAAHH